MICRSLTNCLAVMIKKTKNHHRLHPKVKNNRSQKRESKSRRPSTTLTPKLRSSKIRKRNSITKSRCSRTKLRNWSLLIRRKTLKNMLTRPQRSKSRQKYSTYNVELRSKEESLGRQEVPTGTGHNGHGDSDCSW